MSKVMLDLREVSRTYRQGGQDIVALRPFSLEVKAGEIVALVGASGCGKSTLLHIAGLLMQPNSGDVTIDGASCRGISERQATMVRREKLGFVYQFHHLLPELTVEENVAVPLILQGQGAHVAKVQELLAQMGLKHRMGHLPSELSGGEQQRVAIARALIHSPALFLADEPTGNLDPDTAQQVETVMLETLRARGASALIVTHNPEMAARMDRVVRLDKH